MSGNGRSDVSDEAPAVRMVRTSLTISLAAVLLACGHPGLEDSLADAQRSYAAGDYRAALIYLRNALQVDEDNAVAQAYLARTWLAVGDIEQAQLHLSRAVELGAPPEQFAVPFAQIHIAANEATEALEMLNSISAENQDSEYWIARADALIAQDALQAASLALDRADVADGAAAEKVFARARLAAAGSNFQEAEELLNRVSDLDPEHAEAMFFLSGLLIEQGRLEEASRSLSQAAEFFMRSDRVPRAAAALVQQVDVYLGLLRVDDAAATAEQLSSLMPDTAISSFANGAVSYRRGDFEEAIAYLRVAVARSPEEVRFVTLLGLAHLAAGNHGQAEQQFLSVLSQDPSAVSASWLLAETRLQQQRPAAALEALSLVDSADTVIDFQSALLAGIAHLQLNELENALTYLERAVALQPENQMAVLELARVYGALGRGSETAQLLGSSPALTADESFAASAAMLLNQLRNGGADAARSYVESLVARTPEEPRAYLVEALFHHFVDDRAASIQSIEAALRQDSDFLPAHLMSAIFLASDGRTEQAQRELSALLQTEPDNVHVLTALGQLAMQRGNADRAESYFVQAALVSDTVPPKLRLARFYLSQGKVSDAREYAESAAELTPSNVDVSLVRGIVAMRGGAAAEAETLLGEVWAAFPARSDVALLLAQAQAANSNLDDARQTLSEAFDRAPGNFSLLRALTAVELELGNHELAISLAQRLQSEFRAAADGYVLEARARIELREHEAAARLLGMAEQRQSNPSPLVDVVSGLMATDRQSAVRLLGLWLLDHPTDTQARLLRAQTLQASGQNTEALAEFEHVLGLDSESVVALNNAAWISHELGEERALEYAARALELSPANAAVLDTFGWILISTQRAEEGIGYVESALELAPGEPEIQYHLGVAQVQLGQVGAARQTLESLLADPLPASVREEAQRLLASL